MKPLVVTPAALVIAAGQSATFTACTQYERACSVASSNQAAATVPSKVVPTQVDEDGPYIATVVVSVPANARGEAVITVTAKKGNQRTVTITVLPLPENFEFTGEVVTYQVPMR